MIARIAPVALLAAALAVAGCDSPEARFHLDRVYIHKTLGPPEDREEAAQVDRQLQNLKEVMVGLFGTPDDPHVPQVGETDASAVLDQTLLEMAAGPVGRTEDGLPQGLYRQHCVHCHGVTGDGAGPTAAFLNPYPRDFRMGKFKFKSTPLGVKPTHDDLYNTVAQGIPDTAMPAHMLLADDEVDSLVHYVKYLAIRGEVERRLIESITDIDPDDVLLSGNMRLADPEQFQVQVQIVKETVDLVFQQWANASSLVTEAPEPQDDWMSEESIRHGRDLFFGTTANCVKCHGQLALGDGETGDFDDWTKEIDDKNPAARAHEFLALGVQEPRLLDPRPIRPRNLRAGVYRGGRRPIDLYLRVKNGIEGTPMPAAPAALTPEDIWSIVAYVRSLPHEALSRPAGYQIEYDRERL